MIPNEVQLASRKILFSTDRTSIPPELSKEVASGPHTHIGYVLPYGSTDNTRLRRVSMCENENWKIINFMENGK